MDIACGLLFVKDEKVLLQCEVGEDGNVTVGVGTMDNGKEEDMCRRSGYKAMLYDYKKEVCKNTKKTTTLLDIE